MRYYSIMLYVITTCVPLISLEKHGLICVPVADLVGQSMRSFYGRSNSNHLLFYNSLPECGAGPLAEATHACPRLHQALLHDPVEIVQRRGSEVRVKIENSVLVTNNTLFRKTFWTKASNIIPCSQIKNIEKVSQYTLATLIHPTYIQPLNITLSVGTQMPCTPQEEGGKLGVYILNKKAKMFELCWIPKHHCLPHTSLTINGKIAVFVSLLHNWAHQTDGLIPYVWGGSSFTTLASEPDFQTQKIYMPNGAVHRCYTYHPNRSSTKTGFDCSGLISRAAQIAGIPYYCKNSSTAARILKPLAPGEAVQAGDLIWFPGHIIVISNIQTNSIIEARGYEHGYGKVHEITLAEQFENIRTYSELVDAYLKKQPINRLDKQGNVVQIIKDYKILILRSVFDSPFASKTTLNTLPIK